jgi:hypothetical protein
MRMTDASKKLLVWAMLLFIVLQILLEGIE